MNNLPDRKLVIFTNQHKEKDNRKRQHYDHNKQTACKDSSLLLFVVHCNTKCSYLKNKRKIKIKITIRTLETR